MRTLFIGLSAIWLTTPSEIRLIIYRYLLLGYPGYWLDPPFQKWKLDDEVDDSLTTSSLPLNDVVDYEGEGKDDSFERERAEYHRHPAILRTNRPIYAEASCVLYSELKILVTPGDILCRDRSLDDEIVKPSMRVWRYNPIYGVGYENEDGKRFYSSPELDGLMEPHAFTRFREIKLFVDFISEPLGPTIQIDHDLNLSSRDENLFISFLNQSSIIRHFVNILSRSPLLNQLTISLEVTAEAAFPEAGGHIDEDEREGQSVRTSRLRQRLSKRATILFVDSGVLEPLRELTNDLTFVESEYGEPFSRKYLDMARDIKETVERNFRVNTA